MFAFCVIVMYGVADRPFRPTDPVWGCGCGYGCDGLLDMPSHRIVTIPRKNVGLVQCGFKQRTAV